MIYPQDNFKFRLIDQKAPSLISFLRDKIPAFHFIFILLFSISLIACNEFFTAGESDSTSSENPIITGSPSDASLAIYESADLNQLCVYDDCTSVELPDGYIVSASADESDYCAFNDNPNATTQFVLHKPTDSSNGLDLLLSREDLFFLAWVSLRYKINPHFLVGVMIQESFANCAAVSYADAEGCFQITNYYGKLQLQQSYPNRVLDWHWNDSPEGYYPDSIFINPVTWFGESPSTDQFRMTLDPISGFVLSVDVSSVVNFNFGAIGSALYYNWQENFLYFNYSSSRDTVLDIIDSDPEQKAKMMAAAYNGGIGRLASSLNTYGESYAVGLQTETQDYLEYVAEHCVEYQSGSNTFSVSYNRDEVEYIIDLLSYTYPADSEIDWDGLKTSVNETFFPNDETINLVDDVKALIYYISTYDPLLAPEFAEDVNY